MENSFSYKIQSFKMSDDTVYMSNNSSAMQCSYKVLYKEMESRLSVISLNTSQYEIFRCFWDEPTHPQVFNASLG